MITTATREERLRAFRNLLKDHERTPAQIKSDINVTPLVDVALVLLIIFLVVTPLIASGVAVDLPRTLNHSRKPDDGKDIIVSITQDKRLFVGANRVARVEELARAVSQEKRKFPGKDVFVKGDSRVSYGAVREAMEALHDLDIEDVILGTEEAKNIH